MRYYLGFDPGIHGCLSVLDDKDNIIVQYTMPLINGRIDIEELRDLLDTFSRIVNTTNNLYYVIVEQPSVLFGVSKTSMFVMAETVGIVKGLLVGLGYQFESFNPKIWQNRIWITEDKVQKKSSTGKKMVNDTKATSFNAAKRLFPKHQNWFYGDNEDNTGRRTKVNDGLVDSLLIAKYCQIINE